MSSPSVFSYYECGLCANRFNDGDTFSTHVSTHSSLTLDRAKNHLVLVFRPPEASSLPSVSSTTDSLPSSSSAPALQRKPLLTFIDPIDAFSCTTAKFTCQLCDQDFVNPLLLSFHLEINHAVTFESKCLKCNLGFKSRQSFEKHTSFNRCVQNGAKNTATPVPVAAPLPVAVKSLPPIAVKSPPPIAVKSDPPIAVKSAPPIAVKSPPPIAVKSLPPVAVKSAVAVVEDTTGGGVKSESNPSPSPPEKPKVVGRGPGKGRNGIYRGGPRTIPPVSRRIGVRGFKRLSSPPPQPEESTEQVGKSKTKPVGKRGGVRKRKSSLPADPSKSEEGVVRRQGLRGRRTSVPVISTTSGVAVASGDKTVQDSRAPMEGSSSMPKEGDSEASKATNSKAPRGRGRGRGRGKSAAPPTPKVGDNPSVVPQSPAPLAAAVADGVQPAPAIAADQEDEDNDREWENAPENWDSDGDDDFGEPFILGYANGGMDEEDEDEEEGKQEATSNAEGAEHAEHEKTAASSSEKPTRKRGRKKAENVGPAGTGSEAEVVNKRGRKKKVEAEEVNENPEEKEGNEVKSDCEASPSKRIRKPTMKIQMYEEQKEMAKHKTKKSEGSPSKRTPKVENQGGEQEEIPKQRRKRAAKVVSDEKAQVEMKTNGSAYDFVDEEEITPAKIKKRVSTVSESSGSRQKGYGSQCAVLGCKNRGSTPNVSIHEFPKEDPRRAEWIVFTGRGKTWEPKKCSVICSEHFDPVADFKATGERRRLNKDAVPTVNCSEA